MPMGKGTYGSKKGRPPKKGGLTAGKDLIDTNTTFSADPTIVHGNVSLGFRF